MVPKVRLFCERFATTGVAYQSAVDAGYSAGGAAAAATRLLRNAECQEYIAQLQRDSTAKEGVTTEWVVAKLKAIADGDVRKMYTVDGALKPIRDMGDNEAAIVAGMDVEELHVGGEEAEIAKVVTKKFKKVDQIRALELLGKYTGAFARDNGQQQPQDQLLSGKLANLTDEQLKNLSDIRKAMGL